jgi:hypothetical protein
MVYPSYPRGCDPPAAIEDGNCHHPGRLAGQYPRTTGIESPYQRLPLLLQTLLIAIGLVVLLTWVITPVLVRFLKPWL